MGTVSAVSSEKRGHEYDRNYVITHDWLAQWETACDRCGESKRGTLAQVFALLWKHRDCEGAARGDGACPECGYPEPAKHGCTGAARRGEQA